ncbi:salicylic acid-binding protein 2-like [Neltuma alba]|uniref:salicylic acid-binding protein 2-like n=1 Tax=Neltuma alba TaxID=207710 RepID=UPI0010A4B6DD|nr:salicylic acid-binding protein 2-like [Prosopis alba]XP_028751961.1 salicylic acid-binding protein 2-like [Prosopis alba]
MASETESKKHYVLVHGSCHGAWCWYKLKPRLESVGHRVSVVDLAASGIHPAKIEDLRSLSDYSEPLLKLLADLPAGEEKVVLVGHSYGGMNIALAADLFPHKIALAVFLTAFLPDTNHKPSYVLEQFLEKIPNVAWLDTEICDRGSLTTLSFGPKFLSSHLYQLCSKEDVELAKSLMRPSSYFVDDLSKANNFSEEGFGSVPRAFIVCNQDLAILMEFQLWMIQNSGVNEVLEIKDADHMAMLSQPQELCDALLCLASKYA